MENKVNKLPLMELFNTLQGEGFHTGKPATFIRLAGCDVGCFWCDVKESWDSDLHPSISVENIVSQSLNYKAKFAVITGGEPTLHDINSLVDQLKEKNYILLLKQQEPIHCPIILTGYVLVLRNLKIQFLKYIN